MWNLFRNYYLATPHYLFNLHTAAVFTHFVGDANIHSEEPEHEEAKHSASIRGRQQSWQQNNGSGGVSALE